MKIETDQEFVRLLNKERNIIWFVVGRYFSDPTDQEDVVQDVMLKAFQSYPSFNGSSKFSTWLYKVATYTAIGARRTKAYNNVNNHTRYLSNMDEAFADLPDEPIKNERHYQKWPALFVRAYERLSAFEQAIIAKYLRGVKPEVQAKELGVTPLVIRVNKFRIIEKIRAANDL